MSATMCPAPVGAASDVPTGVRAVVRAVVPVDGRGGADMHFHGEYTDTNTATGRGVDGPTVARECLASVDLAVVWLLDTALGHPKTITVRIDSRAQQHWFELTARPPTAQSLAARTRTRRHMTEVIRPAIARGDAVRATVTISSAVRPRILTVTPHPHPCRRSSTGAGHPQAGS